MFLVDNDDPTKFDYPNDIIVGPPYGDPCQPLNAAALRVDSAIVGFTGDDSRLETVGWDSQVLAALDQPGFCWGDDGHDTSWPSTIFISSQIVKALGYMVPRTLRRGYFDVAWTILANHTDSARVIDAMFRHDNSKGDPSKPNYDPAYRVPPEVIIADEAAFNEWTNGQALTDIRKVRHVLYS